MASVWAFAPAAQAQGTATMTGGTNASCTYSAASVNPANGNISITCTGGGANTATITLSAASDVLTTPAANSVTLTASCAGSCAGVDVTLAVTAPASGVTIAGNTTHLFAGAGTSPAFTVSGSGGLAAGTATVKLTVAAAGAGITTAPAVGDTVGITRNIPISAGSATFTLGTPSGSLNGGAASSATITASCAGTGCNGSQITLASLANGVTISGNPAYTFTGAGTSTPFSFGNAAPITGSTGSIGLTVNSVPAGVTSTPAVGATNALTQTFNIQGALPQTNAAGIAAFPANATVVENSGLYTINITRTGVGANSPDWYQTVYCSVSANYTPAPAVLNPVNASTAVPSTVIYWLGTTTTATLTINPTTAGVSGGTVTCSFGGSPQVFGAQAAGSNPTLSPTASSFTLTVTKVGSPPPGNCTTTADQTFDLTSGTVSPPSAGVVSGRRAYVNGLSGTQSGAVRFSPAGGQAGGGGTTVSFPSVYGPPPTGNAVEQTVSECPGDFTNTPPDTRFINFNATACRYWDSSQVQFLQFGTLATTPSWACKLDPAKTYYLNFRWRNANGSSSCAGSCAAYVDENVN